MNKHLKANKKEKGEILDAIGEITNLSRTYFELRSRWIRAKCSKSSIKRKNLGANAPKLAFCDSTGNDPRVTNPLRGKAPNLINTAGRDAATSMLRFAAHLVYRLAPFSFLKII